MLEQVAFVRVGPRIFGGPAQHRPRALGYRRQGTDDVDLALSRITKAGSWPRSSRRRACGIPLALVGLPTSLGPEEQRDGSIPITTQRGKGGDICGMVGGPGRVVPRDSRSRGNPGLFRRVVPAFFASHDLPGVVQDGLYVPVDHLPVLLYPGDRHLRRVVFPAAPVLPVYAAVQGWSEIKAGSASSVSSIRMLIGWIWE